MLRNPEGDRRAGKAGQRRGEPATCPAAHRTLVLLAPETPSPVARGAHLLTVDTGGALDQQRCLHKVHCGFAFVKRNADLVQLQDTKLVLWEAERVHFPQERPPTTPPLAPQADSSGFAWGSLVVCCFGRVSVLSPTSCNL